MNATSLTRVASLMGESTRIQMLTMLLDGESHSASELASGTGASAPTASSHLSKLLSGGLIVSERKGRQRFFRLTSTDVAAAVEALGAVAKVEEPRPMPELRFARRCYDHLAGALAIALRNELLRRGALRQGKEAFVLTRSGELFLRTLHIEAEALRGLRRSFARKCLDWTERHHHIGGAVGAALLSHFLDTKWLARTRDSRSLRLTHEGERGFEQVFGIRTAALRNQSRF